jgi:hypothetical protein
MTLLRDLNLGEMISSFSRSHNEVDVFVGAGSGDLGLDAAAVFDAIPVVLDVGVKPRDGKCQINTRKK